MAKYLIVVKEGSNTDFINEYDVTNVEVHMGIIIIAHMSQDTMNKLAQNENIESIERDGHDTTDAVNTKYTTSTTTDAFKLSQANLFHAEGITGTGFKVAVMDTGIQPHTNLKVEAGINAYDNNVGWNTDLVSSHGTQVAGVINAQGVNNDLLGIAPDAKLYCVRIDDGTGGINRTTWSSQIAGISWCVTNGMDAVNCSFSSEVDSIARKTAFKAAADAGLAIFCSGGNTQESGDVTTQMIPYPASYPFTIGNANITSSKVRYSRSCIGRGLNFANVATSVKLTTRDTSQTTSSSYTTGTGTSMAAPANMGMYILYRQKFGEDRDKTLQRMALNAENLGSFLWYGAGLPKYPTLNYKNIQVWG